MVINEQKKAVKRMNKCIFLLTGAVTLYVLGLVWCYFNLNYIQYVIAEGGMIIFINVALIYGVLSIHKTIKSVEHAFPNESLMMVHLLNFVVYTCMFLVTSTLVIVCDGKNVEPGESWDPTTIDPNEISLPLARTCYSNDILGFTQNFFYNYMTLFLMYLINRFSKERPNTEVEDDILDKKVPVIVFIQNKKLLKDAVKNELEMDKGEREKLKAQA